MGNASGSKLAGGQGRPSAPSRPNSSGSGGLTGMDTTVISNGPRKSTVSRPPLPTEEELERRFNELLIQMDLPPERAQILMHFPLEKKWDVICDHNMVHAKDPPEVYLSKLRLFLDPHGAKATRKLDSTSTQILRDLEISLRTNPIEWVREFLSEASRGLDVLIEYLSSRLFVMRQKLELEVEDVFTTSVDSLGGGGGGGTLSSSAKKINLSIRSRKSSDLTRNEFRKSAKRDKDRKLGDVTDDIHLCIMCMRAIMNNKFGFNMVIKHKQAINSIALSLIHERLRTKALVLELLAAICLLKGGHEIILGAFDSFKQEMRETHRFQTLVSYFTNPTEFQIEFMVACMQFINIVVHSVEDMNFRVALQYEFTYLGLDECLEHLKNHESDELAVQISAYVDNEFDVAALMEEAEAKQAALDQVQELEEELGRTSERLSELESEIMSQEVAFEKRLDDLQSEVNLHKQKEEKVRSEYSTLKKNVQKEEEEKKKRQSVLEIRIKELELERDSLKSASTSSLNSNLSGAGGGSASKPSAGAPAPPPPPPPPSLAAAPPPPPPPAPIKRGGGAPPPPPPPGPGAPPPPRLPGMGGVDLPIKTALVPHNRLPTLQIQSIKPSDIKNTVWYTMGDKIVNDLDFAKFESVFKLNAGPVTSPGSGHLDGGMSGTIKMKQPQLDTLLDHTRLKNVAICKKRLNIMSTEDLIANVNALDSAAIGLDAIELIQRIMPLPEEIKAYKEYAKNGKDFEKLTEEDRLMSKLSKIERLSTKLDIMSFMSTFYENAHAIKPRIETVYLASKGTRNSRKFQKILEIILAFGNYMNSAKKGSAYGFKLSSLDNLHTTKSTDKRSTIVNHIVDVVNEKFPEAKSFETDLKHTEKASHANLDNIMQEVQDLERRMSLTQRELTARQNNPTTQAKKQQNLVLKDFVDNATEMLSKLSQDAKNAKTAFTDCVEFYGEVAESTDTNTFFAIITRFIHRWKETVEENEKRRKIEQARQRAAENNNELKQSIIGGPQRNGGGLTKKNQASLITEELKSRNRKPLYKQEEVKDGTLEQIIMGIKSEPYRTNDAMRRSVRRNVDRMTSRPFDEDL